MSSALCASGAHLTLNATQTSLTFDPVPNTCERRVPDRETLQDKELSPQMEPAFTSNGVLSGGAISTINNPAHLRHSKAILLCFRASYRHGSTCVFPLEVGLRLPKAPASSQPLCPRRACGFLGRTRVSGHRIAPPERQPA